MIRQIVKRGRRHSGLLALMLAGLLLLMTGLPVLAEPVTEDEPAVGDVAVTSLEEEPTADGEAAAAMAPPDVEFPTADDTFRALAKALDTEPEQLLSSELLMPGDSTSDWIAFLAGRLGYDENDTYGSRLARYILNTYEENGVLDRNKSTEWTRPALTLMALGYDPTAVGEGEQTVDLIADGVCNWTVTDDLGSQGQNAYAYALKALDAGDFEVPADALYTRERIITAILENQTEGAFGLSKGSADVDITAMTLQALAPYAFENEVYELSDGRAVSVGEAIEEALTWLSEQQLPDGTFATYGVATSESCAQVLIALAALGIDPARDERFVKPEGSALEGFLSFRTGNGMFIHMKGDKGDLLATEQAVLALAALERAERGEGSIFDMKDKVGTRTLTVADGENAGDTNGETEPTQGGNTQEPDMRGEHSVLFIVLVVLIVIAFAAAAVILIKRGEKYKHV
ncbi:MAG: terpene cyclase/mutase family protein [Lachnospiraceae bacterium]|nr:terpene cyclase/mutase family protein [Lachnospiraceae bacterium]